MGESKPKSFDEIPSGSKPSKVWGHPSSTEGVWPRDTRSSGSSAGDRDGNRLWLRINARAQSPRSTPERR